MEILKLVRWTEEDVRMISEIGDFFEHIKNGKAIENSLPIDAETLADARAFWRVEIESAEARFRSSGSPAA
jgi:hypothetical protein